MGVNINLSVLLMSDLHDSSRGLGAIISLLNKNKEIGGVVFAGDLTNMGQPLEFAEKFVLEISHFNYPLLWVPGNNDFGLSYKVLQNHTKSLEGRVVKFAGREFTGVGGSPASWESEYQGEQTLNQKDIAGKIFVSHYPPAGLVKLEKFDKEITNNKFQMSNKMSDESIPNNLKLEIRNLELPKRPISLSNCPLMHVCGHIHHTWGIGCIGETKVIKLASSALGYVAIMKLDNLEVEFMRLL